MVKKRDGSGNSVGFWRWESCDTTPESSWARDLGETKCAPNGCFYRCVVRLTPPRTAPSHHVGKRCLFDAKNLQNTQNHHAFIYEGTACSWFDPKLRSLWNAARVAQNRSTLLFVYPKSRAREIISNAERRKRWETVGLMSRADRWQVLVGGARFGAKVFGKHVHSILKR